MRLTLITDVSAPQDTLPQRRNVYCIEYGQPVSYSVGDITVALNKLPCC